MAVISMFSSCTSVLVLSLLNTSRWICRVSVHKVLNFASGCILKAFSMVTVLWVHWAPSSAWGLSIVIPGSVFDVLDCFKLFYFLFHYVRPIELLDKIVWVFYCYFRQCSRDKSSGLSVCFGLKKINCISSFSVCDGKSNLTSVHCLSLFFFIYPSLNYTKPHGV